MQMLLILYPKHVINYQGIIWDVTGKALIDVHKGELKLHVQDEEVTFRVFKAIEFPNQEEYEMQADVGFAGGKATAILEPPL